MYCPLHVILKLFGLKVFIYFEYVEIPMNLVFFWSFASQWAKIKYLRHFAILSILRTRERMKLEDQKLRPAIK